MAPRASAVSRLSGAVSMATIRVAPAMRAPWTTDWPTPPQPSTATDDPGHTAAVLSTAPTPVVTPQPMSASCSSGRSVCTLTSERSSTTAWSANVPMPSMGTAALPSPRASRRSPRWSASSSHSRDSPRRQNQHAPHAVIHVQTTRSPGATSRTSRPTSSTTPAPSWPRTIGGSTGE